MDKRELQRIKNGILNLLIDQELQYYQKSDSATFGSIKSLVLAARQNLYIPAEQLIEMHKAVLLKELYYGTNPAMVAKILNVLKSVKNEKIFQDYLKSAPELFTEFNKKTSTLSLFISKEYVEKWRNNIEQIIENFLKQ